MLSILALANKNLETDMFRVEIESNVFFQIYKIRPDTQLPQSRAGGQGPYLRSLDHLGRSSKVKE